MSEGLFVSFNAEERMTAFRFEKGERMVAELRLPTPDGLIEPAGALMLQAFLNRVLPQQLKD